MKITMLILLAVGFLIASRSFSNDARERTVRLEKMADRIERAQKIPPETEESIRNTLRSMQHHKPPIDERLHTRQKFAIERIEASLGGQSASVPTGLIRK